MKVFIGTTLLLVATAMAQQVGTSTPETHPTMTSQTCTAPGSCKTESTKIVLDANWRWLHKVGGSTNCYTGNKWDATLCPDSKTCVTNCALDGGDYSGTYGIQASGSSVSIKLVTKGQYSTNIGSRIYMMADDTKYKMFKLLNKEFTFDVDPSNLPCGLNGALYFSQMDEDGGMSRFPANKAGAKYGTGYCDAQCARDIKFINGDANVKDWKPSETDVNAGTGSYGSCCAEMDIWEANSVANAYTTHPCKSTTQQRCTGDSECGTGKDSRYTGFCDMDGCDFNPFRMGDKTFYGAGSKFKVDSTKPFTVVTQFITDDGTDNGNLIEIRRVYKQGGKVIENAMMNTKGVDKVNYISDKVCSQMKVAFGDKDDHKAKGGFKQMGASMKKGMVLVMSLWDDHAAHCLWLDSKYPTDKDASVPGVLRGTCETTTGDPKDVEAKYPEATVKFSNIKFGAIGSTTDGVGKPSGSATSSSVPAAEPASEPASSGSGATSAPSSGSATTAPGSAASAPTSSTPVPAPAAEASGSPASGSELGPGTVAPATGPETAAGSGSSAAPTSGTGSTTSNGSSTVPTSGSNVAPSNGSSNTPAPNNGGGDGGSPAPDNGGNNGSPAPNNSGGDGSPAPDNGGNGGGSPPSNNGGEGVAKWGQCGGNGYKGPTTCKEGTCKKLGDWYSQCQ